MAKAIDRTRFEALVHAHHAAAFRAAHRVLRDAAAAQDVTQELFLRVLDGRVRVPEGANEARGALAWWAVRIAWNTRRSETRRAEREGRHAVQRGHAHEEDDRHLWGLVDELPDDLRVPLTLRFVDGVTFARIGEALGIGESAAFERVGKALGKLRHRLGQVGLGAWVPERDAELEAELLTRLPRAAAAEPAAHVPPALAAKLVALHSGGAAWSVGALAALVGTAATAAGAAWFALSGGDSPRAQAPDATAPPAPLVSSRADTSGSGSLAIAPAGGGARDEAPRAATTEARAALDAAVAALVDPHIEEPGAAVAAALSTGTVTGRVVDASGAPLADLAVRVESREREGKLARYVARGRTDSNGAFEVVVALADAEGGLYRALVEGATHSAESSEERRVEAGTRVDVGALVATARDASSGLAGVVAGFGTPGARAGGATIRGSLATVEPLADRPLAEQVTVHVRVAPTGEWASGEVAADGSFTIAGLGPGKHRVMVSPAYHARRSHEDPAAAPSWFDVELAEGQAESAGHVVTLKRADDPRDVGDHAAEIHGRVVARDDGRAVSVSVWAHELDLAPDLDADAFRRDWLPNHVFPAPAQRSMPGPLPPPSDRFFHNGYEAGRYVLRCNTEGFASFVSDPITLREREVRADVRVELEAPCSVSGRALGRDGRPLEGALVFVTGVGPLSDEVVAEGDREVRAADGRGYLYINGTEERTKADGAFLIGALPSGVGFRLVAVHPDYAPVSSATFELRPGEARSGESLRFAAPAPR